MTVPDHDSWVKGYVAALIEWAVLSVPEIGSEQLISKAQRHAENVWMDHYPEAGAAS